MHPMGTEQEVHYSGSSSTSVRTSMNVHDAVAGLAANDLELTYSTTLFEIEKHGLDLRDKYGVVNLDVAPNCQIYLIYT